MKFSGGGGRLLLNGMFGVSKGERVFCQELGREVEVLRLIMNLIPFNNICMGAAGDINSLPMFSQWISLEIPIGSNLLWSSEDLRCMFYLFSLGDQWLPFQAFNTPVPAHLAPQGSSEKYYLASRVLGMGFVNSVGIAQHLHRQIISSKGGRGAGLDTGSELRKDKPVPLFS